jgi:hypothetical protein
VRDARVRRPGPLASLAAVLVLALLPAGCGGDDTDTSATTGATATVATAPAAAATATVATTPAADATATTSAIKPPRQTERDRISGCLTKEGYRLQGGAPQATDSDAADYQIIFSGRHGGGYIGFYRNASRAARVGRQLRSSAQRTKGAAAERHGAINIVWVDLADAAARASVRACLVT